MLTGDRIRRTTEARGTKYPIRICEAVQKSEILEPAIAAVESIPLRLLDAESHLTVRVGSPPARSHQQSIKELALTVFGFQQEAAVEETWPGLVIQIALVLVEIAINTEPSIAKLNARYDGVISGIFSRFDGVLSALASAGFFGARARSWLLCLCY